MNGIVADGARRLRKAIEAEVRRELTPAPGKPKSLWARLWIDRKIHQEVAQRMKNVSSPGSLYIVRRLRLFDRD